ncbi:hypothetical protein [Pseudoalteromonas ruthenica]|uniref:hypothetical protein n=1 Tax=Pseudoalteromonas ruthenica TaxID=151081 RepID=UPI0003B35D74|nr:hypothetical protein [Pseudoalteromonas ruthenica]
MTESFLRQRRNLFIINGILLFAFYVKVDISKFTFAGVTFSGFGNPEAIYYFLWVILAYFFYRFSLFFIEDEMSNFTSRWVSLMDTSVNSKLREMAYNHSGGSFNENSMLGYYQLKKSNWTLRYQAEDKNGANGQYSVINMELAISPFKVLWPQFRAILKFCFLTSALTNYLLPALLTFYVVVVIGLSSWEGAIVKLFT